MSRVVAVDGPGGSGKSTVSRLAADRLGWAHLDTGAFYRTATLAVIREGRRLDDIAGIVEVVGAATINFEDGRARLDGEDVSDEIRGSAVTAAVSAVSAIPGVRSRMVDLQRAWVGGGGTVVEGRDIGTVVFPDAAVKVFLTADPVERARRRARDEGRDAEVVAGDLADRDRSDSTRTASPLRAADGAVVIDTTGLSIDDVVERVLDLVDRAGLRAAPVD